MSSLPNVTVLAVLPPPVTGMTLFAQKISASLADRCTVRCLDLSCGAATINWSFRLIKLWRTLGALAQLAVSRSKHGDTLYMPLNARGAMYYNLIASAIGRLRGYRIAIHHHVYSYIDEFDWRIPLLNRIVGAYGAHIVHCESMQRDFTNRYSTPAPFLYLPPIIVMPEVVVSRQQRPDSPFTLGCISNLSAAKGLPTLVDTFERLAQSGENVQLLLAGPCRGRRERRLIARAQESWPGRVQYRGPVYGEEKARFFADIDVFLLPTRSESWGIVLSEAMSAGHPVIAFDRGCIPWVVQDGCGQVIDRHDDFADRAAEQIITWIRHPDLYDQARRCAHERHGVLREIGQRQFADFLNWMSHRPAGHASPVTCAP